MDAKHYFHAFTIRKRITENASFRKHISVDGTEDLSYNSALNKIISALPLSSGHHEMANGVNVMISQESSGIPVRMLTECR